MQLETSEKIHVSNRTRPFGKNPGADQNSAKHCQNYKTNNENTHTQLLDVFLLRNLVTLQCFLHLRNA